MFSGQADVVRHSSSNQKAGTRVYKDAYNVYATLPHRKAGLAEQFGQFLSTMAHPNKTNSSALKKRRTNYTQHDPETMEYLVHFHDWVGLYLWYGLIGIVGIVTVVTWASKLQVGYAPFNKESLSR